jgi:pyruvate dehydrogenase E1 component
MAILARQMLADRYNIDADVWSATSYKNCTATRSMSSATTGCIPTAKRQAAVCHAIASAQPGPIVAVSDYVKALPAAIARGSRAPDCLGTDGFGRSDTREGLRDFFEVDARHIAHAAVSATGAATVIGEGRHGGPKAIEDLGYRPGAPATR